VHKIISSLAVATGIFGAAAAMAFPAMTADAAGTAGTVTARDAYLRPYPQSWFIGTLKQHDHFDVQASQNGYYWGYAQGSYNGCAWIVASSVDKGTAPSAAPDCGTPRRLALPDSAHAPARGYDVDGDGDYAGDGEANDPDRLTKPYQVTCSSAHLFGNYRGGRLLDPGTELTAGTPVGWRWTTADGRAAVVRYDAGDQWAYIQADCVGPRQ
jgi:hypothetical protein